MKMNEIDQIDFIDTFDSLVKGVLNKLGIYSSASHYDDCYQIALIKLFEAFSIYDGDLADEESLYHFAGFAYTRMKWAVIDACRLNARVASQEEALPESYEELIIADDGLEDNLIRRMDLAHFLTWLDDRELIYLNLFYKFGQVSQVAMEMNLSRKTVYKIRHEIAKKYQAFLQGKN